MSSIKQQQQQNIAYPLKWMDSTFSSEEKVTTLLQPEVENGNVTPTDFHNAKNFYPGVHKHLPFLYASTCAVGTIILGTRFARPRWKVLRLTAVGSVTSGVGFIFGVQQMLDAHVKFARSLENPAGFNKALQNVNIRLGGSTPWNYGLPTRQGGFPISLSDAKSTPNSGDEFQEYQLNETTAWDTPPTPASSASTPASQQNVTPSTPGRWDQIRAANNKGGPVSSWDIIRQNHERKQIQASGDSQSQDSEVPAFETREATARAVDEAQFDAMLEMERRRASRN